MKDASIDDLIGGLADDLRPVRPARTAQGSLWTGAGWLVGGGALVSLAGMRPDLAAGQMPMLSMLAFWLFAAVATAAAWSAIRMGMPGVGRDYGSWRWVGLVALTLPLSALLLAIQDHGGTVAAAAMETGYLCSVEGFLSGLGVGAALTLWLRRGAPTSPTRAGLAVGVAAGAAGATVVALHCPVDNIIHISLWHGLAILLSGVAGRILLPRLLRW